MTTPLLIKSHTGAMVPAKVLDEITCFIGRTKITAFAQEDDSWIETSEGLYVEPCDCTLVHRPFALNDRYEYWSEGKWIDEELLMGPHALEASKRFPHMYRHASIHLRDAPDYQPTRSDV